MIKYCFTKAILVVLVVSLSWALSFAGKYKVTLPDVEDPICIDTGGNACWVIYGIGDDCKEIPKITLLTSLIKEEVDCSGINYILNYDECRKEESGGEGGGGGCRFPLGHPDYCFSCGPCTEGQGGCNRTYQCVEGLECDLTTNKCIKHENKEK